jgi:hypothetical protein
MRVKNQAPNAQSILELIVNLVNHLLNDGSSLNGRTLVLGAECVLSVLLYKRDKALERTVTLVIDEVTAASGLELERGEALDAERYRGRQIVLLSLHLGTVKEIN